MKQASDVTQRCRCSWLWERCQESACVQVLALTRRRRRWRLQPSCHRWWWQQSASPTAPRCPLGTAGSSGRVCPQSPGLPGRGWGCTAHGGAGQQGRVVQGDPTARLQPWAAQQRHWERRLLQHGTRCMRQRVCPVAPVQGGRAGTQPGLRRLHRSRCPRGWKGELQAGRASGVNTNQQAAAASQPSGRAQDGAPAGQGGGRAAKSTPLHQS